MKLILNDYFQIYITITISSKICDGVKKYIIYFITSENMQTITLNNGVKIPVIGFGT